jgi:hypothetical protein
MSALYGSQSSLCRKIRGGFPIVGTVQRDSRCIAAIATAGRTPQLCDVFDRPPSIRIDKACFPILGIEFAIISMLLQMELPISRDKVESDLYFGRISQGLL